MRCSNVCPLQLQKKGFLDYLCKKFQIKLQFWHQKWAPAKEGQSPRFLWFREKQRGGNSGEGKTYHKTAKLAVGLPIWWKLVVGNIFQTIVLEALDALGRILFFVFQTLRPPEGQTSHLDVKSASCLPSHWFCSLFELDQHRLSHWYLNQRIFDLTLLYSLSVPWNGDMMFALSCWIWP